MGECLRRGNPQRDAYLFEASHSQRHARQRGFEQMGTCKRGEMPQDIWIVRNGESAVLVLHTLDSRVAVATLSSARTPLSGHKALGVTAGEKFCTRTLNPYITKAWGAWEYPAREVIRKGYAHRVDVPRAVEIHAVVPTEEHILIYYKPTKKHRHICLWRIDKWHRFEAIGLCGSSGEAVPYTAGKVGRRKFGPWNRDGGKGTYSPNYDLTHIRPSWDKQWGVDASPMLAPEDFFGDFPRALVVMAPRQDSHVDEDKCEYGENLCEENSEDLGEEDKKGIHGSGDGSQPSTEVVRFSMKYWRKNDVVIQREHFLCTLPNLCHSELALA